MDTRFVRLAAVATLACSLQALAAAPAKEETIALKLTAEDIVTIGPDKGVTRQQFDSEFGEIGIVVKRDKFPIPAPNCKHDVIVRLPDLDKQKPGDELNKRWKMFQQVQTTLDKKKTLELSLVTKPYLKAVAGGKYELPYCSAYFQLK